MYARKRSRSFSAGPSRFAKRRRIRRRRTSRKPKSYGRRFRGTRGTWRKKLTSRKMNYTNNIIGQSRVVIVPWTTAGSITFPTGGASNAFVPFTDGDCRLNSIYDPYLKLGGQTTAWYTFLSSLYHKYEVLSSKYTLTIRQRQVLEVPSTAVDHPTYKVGVKVDDDGSLPSLPNWTAFQADPNTTMKSLHFNTNGDGQVSITKYFNRKKWFNNSEDNEADFGANPTDGVYALPFYQMENLGGLGLGYAPKADYVIDMKFVVRVWDPKDIQDLTGDMVIVQPTV